MIDEIDLKEVVEYVQHLTKFRLIPQQVEVLSQLTNLRVKQQIINCGRSFSKSMLCAATSLYFADVYARKIGRPVVVLLISHQREIYVMMDKFFRNCPELYDKLRVKGETYSMPQDELQLSDTMSRVLIRLDTSKQIRGIHSDLTIIDEAQSVDKDIILSDSMPTAIGDIGKFVLVGTPSDRNSYFEEAIVGIKRKTPVFKNWYVSTYPSNVCPWLIKQIDIWKRAMDIATYTSEVLAEIPSELIISPFKPYLKKCTKDCTPDPFGRPENYFVAGLDLAYGKSNKCSIVVLEKSTKSIKSKVVYTELCIPDMKHIADALGQFGTRLHLVVYDSKPPELAAKVNVEVARGSKKFMALTVTQKIKDSMLSQTLQLMNGNNLGIAKYYHKLLRELEHYTREKTKDKNLADALLLAIYQGPEVVIPPVGHSHFHISQVPDDYYHRYGMR